MVDVLDFGRAMAPKEGHLKRINLINIHIDNVWMRIHPIKIQSGGHSDENDITNFSNVIFE
jgi:hypothetical protein